jgi:hypothetical protein
MKHAVISSHLPELVKFNRGRNDDLITVYTGGDGTTSAKMLRGRHVVISSANEACEAPIWPVDVFYFHRYNGKQGGERCTAGCKPTRPLTADGKSHPPFW